MEGGYTVISGYFNDILTKTAFYLKPKSTKKGGNRELIEGLGD